MFAQCPACLTVFELDASALVAAHGRLRCGECGDVFDALRTLTDRLPGPDARLTTAPLRFLPPEVTQTVQLAIGTSGFATLMPNRAGEADPTPAPESAFELQKDPSDIESNLEPSSQPDAPPIDVADTIAEESALQASDSCAPADAAVVHGSSWPATLEADAVQLNTDDGTDNRERGGEAANDPSRAFANALAARGEDEAPSLVADDRPSQSGADDLLITHEAAEPRFARGFDAPVARNGRWLVLAALFTVVLIGEIGWAERAQWIDNAIARSWLDPLCTRLHCRLPLRHAADQLQLLSRDVRPQPSVPGALMISATIRNDADFTQAFPVVAITLSDLDEKRIAMRRFRPDEYLQDAGAITRGIGAGAVTTLAFEIADPGKNARAFEFQFEE